MLNGTAFGALRHSTEETLDRVGGSDVPMHRLWKLVGTDRALHASRFRSRAARLPEPGSASADGSLLVAAIQGTMTRLLKEWGSMWDVVSWLQAEFSPD